MGDLYTEKDESFAETVCEIQGKDATLRHALNRMREGSSMGRSIHVLFPHIPERVGRRKRGDEKLCSIPEESCMRKAWALMGNKKFRGNMYELLGEYYGLCGYWGSSKPENVVGGER